MFRQVEYAPRSLSQKRRKLFCSLSKTRVQGQAVALYCQHFLHYSKKKQLICDMQRPPTSKASLGGGKMIISGSSDPFERNALRLTF
jgi:hypothetical protein